MGKGQELLDAAREGDKRIVEKIIGQITKRSGPFTSLRRGAGVNVQDDNGYTPLHHACLHGHEEIVRLLLSVDASPCIVDKKGVTALYLAAWKGDERIVGMLLAHSNPPVNIDQLTSDQESALLIAAQFGNKEVVAQLLARGADVTVRNIRDETALDLAAQYGRLEVVQLLLHAKPQLVDIYRFPGGRARQFPHTPLHRASKNGHKDVVAALIAAGVDPNVRTANGTALHEAACFGKEHVVRALLARGADMAAADRRGRTVMKLLAEFPEEATRRVRKAMLDHMAKNGYESEEDLPGFPVQDHSPTIYQNYPQNCLRSRRSPSDFYDEERTAPKTPNDLNHINAITTSSSSSSLNKNHPQSFVKKLASKLGIKTKFSSAPNISNTAGLESEVDKSKLNQSQNRSNTNTILIGNSKFFKKLSKKDESGDIICNDEFDTISLDRIGTLERTSTVNRSNRSCPGFKVSLPNISENTELSDSRESLQDSISHTESKIMIPASQANSVEAVNCHVSNINIFEPRDEVYPKFKISNSSTEVAVNDCYESFDFYKNPMNSSETNDLIPKPHPRSLPKSKTTNVVTIYENVIVEAKNVPPKPAIRNNINDLHAIVNIAHDSKNNDGASIVQKNTPEPTKRTVLPIKEKNECSPSVSRSSTLSSDSMSDETNLEDILLSQKSKSFKRKSVVRCDSNKSEAYSFVSDMSDITDVSALDHVDCSINNDKSIYLTMTGTLPNIKAEGTPKNKVLFRHKTFSNIEVDKPSTLLRAFPKENDDFLKETLAHYHIRGTGHCIYSAPTVEEFLYIFNRESLQNDIEPPFTKVLKRDSYFETAICFCKPSPPKYHKSAEDLLQVCNEDNVEKVKIDTMKLLNKVEINLTSFRCFCDDESCKFHVKKRESPSNFIVKFSAINKSLSTPDITLASTPVSEKGGLVKNKSFPNSPLEDAYAIVEVKDIASRIATGGEAVLDYKSDVAYSSQPSTLSTTSGRPYSLKDVAEVLSLNESTSSNDASLTLDASKSLMRSCSQRQSSSSDTSVQLSLHSCDSFNSATTSILSFKSCIEEVDSDDETLQSDAESVSDVDTIKSDGSGCPKPWVHSDSFRFGSKESRFERVAGVALEESSSESDASAEELEGGLGVASLECGLRAGVRSGSGRRRWDEADGTSEGDALSVSSAASSTAPHHLAHHHEYSKVSPTPPKKPPRRNLSVSPTHANSPSSGYSYELRAHARSQDDLDDIQVSKHYLKHGRSVDQYVDGKLSHSEYEDNHHSSRVVPVPNPRPSLKIRSQPVAITAMYENVVIKEQNPRRKLRRNNFTHQYENYEPPRMNEGRRKYSAQKSSLESLLDDNQSMNSPSDCERYYDGSRVHIPLSPTHYEQPPTPDHPPPSAKQAERSIHERIRPLSQEYKRRSLVRDNQTETEVSLLRAASAASVASGATDCVEEYVCDVPFAGLFKGSTTTLDGIGLRPAAERPKTLRKLKSVYDASPTDPHSGNCVVQDRPSNGMDDEVRRRSNTSSSTQSGDKPLSILSPFDEQEEWAKISEIMASFGSKLVRESVFVSELEKEFTSRLGLSCSESSLSPSVASNLGLWLSALGLHDYEQLFIDGGFDDVDFINGIIEENDLREMGIDENDRTKILDSSKQLPLKIAEISVNHNNNSIGKVQSQNESVEEWLKNINLEQYSETFRKHLYSDMDRVRRIWEVELTAVLEIQKPGHRKRILASVSGQQNGPVNIIEDIDLSKLKTNIQQLKDEIKEKLPENLKAIPPPIVPTLAPPGGETLKRSKKNRPAPQPPRPSDLEIRAPSELLVGVPGALKTQWKHQPFVLVTGAVTYVANYLGSTVVKELRGTESTKKSIQKLKKSTKEPRDSPDIILSISYRGVKFLNTITRELVCEHEIRNIHCACQDADDLTHFAYITKDHATKSHYCHVFCVATMDQATEVILTLGEAFEVAYQMALREQSNRIRVQHHQPSHAKTPTHDPMTTTTKEKPNVNHGRSHSITEIKLNGHQLKVAPIPASLSNEDFQMAARSTDGARSPRTPLLKAPIASTEEL